jgi:hypothetical protein
LEKRSKTKGTRRFPSLIIKSTLLFELIETKIIYKRKDKNFNGFHLHIIVIINSRVMIGRKKFFHIKFTRYKEDEIFTLWMKSMMNSYLVGHFLVLILMETFNHKRIRFLKKTFSRIFSSFLMGE